MSTGGGNDAGCLLLANDLPECHGSVGGTDENCHLAGAVSIGVQASRSDRRFSVGRDEARAVDLGRCLWITPNPDRRVIHKFHIG